MATALSLTRDQIINTALRRLRAVASGSSGTANEVTDAAQALNVILKELEHDPAIAFNLNSSWTSLALSAGDNSKALADITHIGMMAAYWVNGTTNAVTELTPAPLEQMLATNDNNSTTDADPLYFYCTRYSWQANTVLVSPAPSANGTLYYFPKVKIDLYDNSSDTGAVPDAWARFLIRALTADLAWEYGKSLSEIQQHESLAEKSYQKMVLWETQAITQHLTDMMASNRNKV